MAAEQAYKAGAIGVVMMGPSANVIPQLTRVAGDPSQAPQIPIVAVSGASGLQLLNTMGGISATQQPLTTSSSLSSVASSTTVTIAPAAADGGSGGGSGGSFGGAPSSLAVLSLIMTGLAIGSILLFCVWHARILFWSHVLRRERQEGQGGRPEIVRVHLSREDEIEKRRKRIAAVLQRLPVHVFEMSDSGKGEDSIEGATEVCTQNGPGMDTAHATASANEQHDSSSEICVVCMSQYEGGDCICTLPCRHEFHKACVEPWLREHFTCPLCKLDLAAQAEDDALDEEGDSVVVDINTADRDVIPGQRRQTAGLIWQVPEGTEGEGSDVELGSHVAASLPMSEEVAVESEFARASRTDGITEPQRGAHNSRWIEDLWRRMELREDTDQEQDAERAGLAHQGPSAPHMESVV